MFDWFNKLQRCIEAKTSYETVVMLQDLILFLFAFFLGATFVTYLISTVFIRTKKIDGEKYRNITMIRFKDDNDKVFFINDNNNVFETMYTLLLIIFSPWFTRKSYTKRDEKRTKIFIVILIIIEIIVTIFALLSIFIVYTE